MDLFTDYADRQDPESGQRLLGPQGLRDLLVSIGEKPGDAVLQRMFETADVDGSGSIDVEEFLDAADTFLGTTPARCVLVVGGPGTGKGMLCERLVRGKRRVLNPATIG
jgi:SpoVK/Ycf46/Vps4 family AAA+-type ATPase